MGLSSILLIAKFISNATTASYSPLGVGDLLGAIKAIKYQFVIPM